MKRFLRGSSSQSSKEKQSKENKKAKYNLPRVAEVRPCEWPCDDFLRAAGIHDDFYYFTTRKRAIDGIDTNGAPDKRCAISIY